MKRLTARRINGAETEFWSSAGREELEQALGAYEDTGYSPEEIMDIRLGREWEDARYLTPRERGFYWVTMNSEYGNNVLRAYYDLEWEVARPECVIAWMPMEKQPDPYKG